MKRRLTLHRRGEVSWRDRGAAGRAGKEGGGPGCGAVGGEVVRVRVQSPPAPGGSAVGLFRRKTGLCANSASPRLRPQSFFNTRLALLPWFLVSVNFGGKDSHLWDEFVSSFLNSETESSKVLMCVCLLTYLFFFSSVQMNAKPRIESCHSLGVSVSRYFTRKTKLGSLLFVAVLNLCSNCCRCGSGHSLIDFTRDG